MKTANSEMLRLFAVALGLAGLVQAQTNNPTGAPSVISSPTAAPVPADVTHLNYVAVTTSYVSPQIYMMEAQHRSPSCGDADVYCRPRPSLSRFVAGLQLNMLVVSSTVSLTIHHPQIHLLFLSRVSSCRVFCWPHSVLGGLILFFTAIHCMRRLQAEELEALEKAKAEADEGKKKKEKAGD